MPVTSRKGCIACGPEAFFVPSPFVHEGDQIHASVPLESRHQGWMEIPHGGILMSLLLEAVHHGFDDPFSPGSSDPIRTSFRWGGPTLLLGDNVHVLARREPGGIHGSIRRQDEASPSLTAWIDRGPARLDLEDLDPIPQTLELLGKDAKDKVIPLPYSRNCFVCGSDRSHPGLQRKFFCLDHEHHSVIYTPMGLDPEDESKLFWYRLSDEELHPGALAAILDEVLGWSGFLASRQGGVTVKLEIDFLRPVDLGERMLCFGTCVRVRGKNPQRLFWYSVGGILPFGGTDLSPIALARGQWLAVPKLTEEMRNHLQPAHWLARWFDPGTA